MDGTSQSASERGTAKNDVDNDAGNHGDDDNSVIVTVTEESSKEDSSSKISMADDSSASDEWDGNPRPGDQQGW